MYSIFIIIDIGQMFFPAVIRALGDESSSFKIMIVTDLIIGVAFEFCGGVLFNGGALGTWTGLQIAFVLNFVLQYRLLSNININEAIIRVQGNMDRRDEQRNIPPEETAVELREL